MPSCAPRPGADEERGRRREPERARAGDDQDGDRGGERERQAGAAARASSRTSRRRSRSRPGRRSAATRSASRCTGALPDCASVDEPRDLGERRLGADALGPDDEPAAEVDRGAGDRVAGADLDRDALAGEQRLVDRRVPLDDDAVGRRPSRRGGRRRGRPTRSSLDRDAPLAAVGVEERDLLRAELDQRAQRGAGAALRARLEVAAGEQERDRRRPRPRGRSGRAGGRDGTSSNGIFMPVAPASRKKSATTDQPQADERAERDQRVHRRGARGAGSSRRRRWNGQPPHSTTGVASASASHCQRVNCSAATIPSRSTGSARARRRRRGGGAGAAVGSSSGGRLGVREPCRVADLLDRLDERRRRDTGRVVLDGRPLGRVVDRGLTPSSRFSLRSIRAAQTAQRHPVDRELDPPAGRSAHGSTR